MLFSKLYLSFLNRIHSKKYNKVFRRIYSKKGVVFEGSGPSWISPDVWIDRYNCSNITIGENVKISREVMILDHDYSVNHVYKKMNPSKSKQEDVCITGKIVIGSNTFVGARVTILPNTIIGRNCIIGACSVVKGTIPDNSICVGNPCRVIGNVQSAFIKYFEGGNLNG